MSEIWNEFEKIAIDQGLVTEAKKEERTERKQEDASKMPARYDSVADDAIRMLYGVEPETIFDKKDKGKDITEIAHPETAVAMRAYDAMNAVWENLHQRQDMMAYIAQKMPNGHLTQRRYVAAKQELINALVRSAFTLDNQEESELMALADSCAVRLNKRGEEVLGLQKEASPLAIAGLAAPPVVLLVGAWYMIYGAQTAQNVYVNSQQVLESLNQLSDKPYADGIRADVQNLMDMAESVYEVKDQLSQVRSVDVAMSVAESAQYKTKVEAINQRIKAYIAQARKVARAIPGWVTKIESVAQTTGGDSDWMAKLKGMADILYDTDEEDLVEKLYGQKAWMGLGEGRTGGLYEAIQKDIQMMTNIMSSARSEVQKQSQIKTPTPAPTPTTPQNTQAPIAQAPVGLPQPTPAPAPSAPGTPLPPPAGAARKPPQGFGGLPQW